MDKNERNTVVVRIPKGLMEQIEEFLKSEMAYKLGFTSKIGVIENAVRDLLIKYGFIKIFESRRETT